MENKKLGKDISAREYLDIFVKGVFLNKTEEELDKMAAEMEQNYTDGQVVSEAERRFRDILISVGRDGTEGFLEYLKIVRFFTAPASVFYHCNWKGGLVDHSLKVYDCAMKIREEVLSKDPSVADSLNTDSIAVAALLHDVCKTDEFGLNADGTPKHIKHAAHLGGHGYKSVVLILLHGYPLTGDEALAIRWHMGSARIKDEKEKAECEAAKKESALTRLIIKSDHMAAK